MRWKGHAESMVEMRNSYKDPSGNLKEADHMEDACVDGRILLWHIC
jgi:hypothetical protein